MSSSIKSVIESLEDLDREGVFVPWVVYNELAEITNDISYFLATKDDEIYLNWHEHVLKALENTIKHIAPIEGYTLEGVIDEGKQ